MKATGRPRTRMHTLVAYRLRCSCVVAVLPHCEEAEAGEHLAFLKRCGAAGVVKFRWSDREPAEWVCVDHRAA